MKGTVKFIMWTALASILVCASFAFSPVSLPRNRRTSWTLGSDMDDEIPEGAVPLDSPEVKYVLGELMKTLEKSAGVTDSSSSSSKDTEDMMRDIDVGFAKLLSEIKSSSKLTETQKRLLTAETALTMSDAKEGDTNAMDSASATSAKEHFGLNPVQTLAYSQQAAPYLIVHGSGPVGTALKAFMKSLGSSVDVKYIDASALAVVPEEEIDYAVRDCRSIIIAADDEEKDNNSNNSGSSGSGGGFLSSLGLGGRGGNNTPGGSKMNKNIPRFVVNEKALKRLLNAAMKARNKASSKGSYNVKVVALAAAAKEPQSLASLLGGETFNMENEVILQCQKRQIGYAVMKVGCIVDLDSDQDRAMFISNNRLRPALYSFNDKDKDKDKDAGVIPMIFTRSRVEPGEMTDKGTAVEALLRAASHPQTNSTISVVTIDAIDKDRGISDDEWDDQFQKIDGPELLRIPLQYASDLQMVMKVGRVVSELQEPGKGLITPIEVQRGANGVRILFRPKNTAYLSSKEEKEKEKEKEGNSDVEGTKNPRGNYVPPEALIDPKEASGSLKSKEGASKSNEKSKKRQKPEGGLEVVVDSKPYRRVRIRRCNMGPDPVVKEESEALILKALQQGIRNLEAFYEKMIKEGYDG